MSLNRTQGILCAILLAVLFFGCERKPSEKLYTEALSEWKAGNLVRARALLEKSIRRRPESPINADAYNRLGLLLWEMGETGHAAAAFNESCRINAGHYAALCNLGIALGANNDFLAAERAFREAALLQPNDARPLAYAGLVYLNDNKWTDAERNLKLALTRSPNDPQLLSFLALTELHTRGAQQALKTFQALLRKNPDYAPALFNSASIQQHWLKNPPAARTAFERYLKQSDGTGAYAEHARSFLTAKDTPTESPRLDIQQNGRPDRAKAELQFQKALALHRSGKLKQAIEGYTLALRHDNTYEQAWYNLGLASYADGELPRAGEAFTKAVELNPAFTDARYNAALVDYYHLGRTDRALRELDVVLAQKPAYQPAIDLLAQIKAQSAD